MAANADRLLAGQVIVVTGAGRGIGAAIAVSAAAEGARVVVADYGVPLEGGTASSAAADEVLAGISKGGGEAIAVVDSVATVAGAERMIGAAVQAWGRLDGVVCCAAIQSNATLLEYTEEVWDSMIATHLKGHFTVYQAAARQMVRAGTGGSIVGFGSGYVQGTARRSAYRAAKAGIIGLTKSVAIELEPHGIRVNCITPAANTRMTVSANVVADGDPEDVAPLALYLLSPLSGTLTGQVISIAGRRIATWCDPYQNRVSSHPGRWTPGAIAQEAQYLFGSGRVGTPIAVLNPGKVAQAEVPAPGGTR
jgi:NAD(P)-dependent dehydrogenase (short-subunit alcohol dehydrogenase family)